MEDRHARHRRRDTDRRRRPVEGFRTVGTARFARLVTEALATLPPKLVGELADVEVHLAQVPPPGASSDEVLLATCTQAPSRSEQDAEAPPRTSVDEAEGTAPRDVLTLYRRPLEARAHDRHDLTDLVQEAVVHELARHRGLDDDRLDELGWS